MYEKITTEKNYLRALWERMIFSLITQSITTMIKKTIIFNFNEFKKKTLPKKKNSKKKKT
jgi:hypothetical protein